MGSIWDHFDEILGSKNDANLGLDLGYPFCRIIAVGAALAGLWRGYLRRGSPQGGTLSRAEGSYITTSGTQTQDPTRRGPEARRIVLQKKLKCIAKERSDVGSQRFRVDQHNRMGCDQIMAGFQR